MSLLLAASLFAVQASTSTLAPNYSRPGNWLCLPGKNDLCSTPLATTALNPNVYFDDTPSEATGTGSAESHRTKDGQITNKGANDTIAKSIEQVGQMHTRVQGYVTTLRTMSIGGTAGSE